MQSSAIPSRPPPSASISGYLYCSGLLGFLVFMPGWRSALGVEDVLNGGLAGYREYAATCGIACSLVSGEVAFSRLHQ